MTTRIEIACAAKRQHLANRAHLAAAGLGPTAVARALQRGALIRVRRGVYSPTTLGARAQHLVSGGKPDPAYLAQVRAALMSLGDTAMAGGRSAAVLWGFDMYVEPAVVEVVTAFARSGKSPRGVTLRRLRRARAVQSSVLGLEPVRALSPVMTVIDCALTRPLREAVVIADSALRSGKVRLVQLQRAVEACADHPRAARLRRMLDLVDADSGSVLETLMRLLLAQHGLRPESQAHVVDAEGRLIGRVDFLFRDQRLVIECDGRRWHDPEDVREKDRVRDNELERAAWRLLRVTWAEVVHDPARVIAMVRDCLQPWPVAA